ncbi:MAG: translation elongation factor Ts [Cellvibrionaceae bacterium]
MAAISASLVKELRERTGLGMMECKKALKETDGDINVAIENLRKASGLKAEKKAGRTAAEGVVAVKVADDNSYGVVVEVNSETDFAARDENFLGFVSTAVEAAFTGKTADVVAGLEDQRQALVQKIGENIGFRRGAVVEGAVVGAYVHSNSKIAVLVELEGGNGEVARDVAMHIAAVNPRVINTDDMPAEELEKEKDIIKAQPDMAGKPENIVEKMMVGRINKFLKENSLTEQPFVKNPDVTVGQLVKDAGASIKSMVRYEVGDGIVVEEADFAAEVAAQVEAANK